MNDYYTYAYLREDGTPYYIGKGRRFRATLGHHRIPKPPKNRILFLKKNLTEEEALRHEKYMIYVLGRKDIGTGILRNLTDGGELGPSGWVPSEETKQKIRKSKLNVRPTERTKKRIADSVRGFKWYNNGHESIQCRTDPGEGWTKGRLLNWKSSRNENMKWYYNEKGERKMFKDYPGHGWTLGMISRDTLNNHTNKGKKWYNDGKQNKMFAGDPPEGWTLGMMRKE